MDPQNTRLGTTALASIPFGAHNDRKKEHLSVRSISLLTILALLYCPLACAVGHGYGVSSQLASGLEPVIPVCCCCSPSSSTSDPEDSAPSDTQHKDCQGVCNGAVHERHDISIELPELAFLAPYAAFPHVSVDHSTTLRKYDFSSSDQPILSGRQLRTRYLALTC